MFTVILYDTNVEMYGRLTQGDEKSNINVLKSLRRDVSPVHWQAD